VCGPLTRQGPLPSNWKLLSTYLTERRKTKKEGRKINQADHALLAVVGTGCPASRNRPSLSTYLTERRKIKKEGREVVDRFGQGKLQVT
jgi:hypothetical protein